MKEIFNGQYVLLLTIFLMVIVVSCSRSNFGEKEARKIINDFYNDNVPESINDRHLLSAGKKIVPYLMIEIKNSDMPKRRYAIGAIGKIGDKQAIPVLVNIFEDKTELVYIRADAIEAIWHIDRTIGEEYAKKHKGENKEIDRTIELLRKGVI